MSSPSTPLGTGSVETSLIDNSKRFLDSARYDRNDRPALFATLNAYQDVSSRSAAINMAIDEALLELTEVPAIRFYRWDSPALSFGYFGRFADVAAYMGERDLVRRWTGGGIVFHGEDLTYAIVVPANDPAFLSSSRMLYERIHIALRCALYVTAASVAALYERRTNSATVTDRRYNNCFANPVDGDVMLDGRKIAGAAQRRTRTGLLQQGSIQHADLANGLAERFAHSLSLKCEVREIDSKVLQLAEEIAARKYATETWLRKR
jgi:lipoate-protein ligase A